MQEIIERRYRSTFEAAEMLGVSFQTVITWLDFYKIKVKRAGSGSRRLTPQDVFKLTIIRRLTKDYGMTHKQAKKHIRLFGFVLPWKHKNQQ